MNSGIGYGITMAAGLLLSAVLYILRARHKGLPAFRSMAGFAAGILLAYACAKLVYLAFFHSSLTGQGLNMLVRLIPGEFSFVSGCIGFCLGIILPYLRRKDRIPTVLDAWAVPGCLMAAFARFAEIFLDQSGLAELYDMGLPDIEDGSLLACFPFAVGDDYGMWYFAVSTLAAILILAVLLFTRIRESSMRGFTEDAGMSFSYAAFLLCCIRFFLELPRIESLVFYFVHVEQVLAALVMIFLTVRICRRRKAQTGKFPRWPLVLLSVCIIVNGLTQFLRDKPSKFESLMPESVYWWICDNLSPFCYSVYLLTAIALVIGYLVLDSRLRAGYRKSTISNPEVAA